MTTGQICPGSFEDWRERLLGAGRASPSMTPGFAVDDPHHLLDPGADATVKVTAAEPRRDLVVDDATRDHVAQRALDAVAHLDAHRAIVFRDDQQRAVVHPLPPEPPLFRDSQRVLFDGLRRSRTNHQHGQLHAFACLERPKLGFELIQRVLGKRLRLVGDAGVERWYWQYVLCRCHQASAKKCQPKQQIC